MLRAASPSPRPLVSPSSLPLLPSSFSAHAEGVGDAVDVVEPGGVERDLQDGAVVEAHRPKSPVILWRDAGGVARHLRYVLEYSPVLLSNWRATCVLR